MASIVNLKDGDNATLYPVTKYNAVLDANGNSLPSNFDEIKNKLDVMWFNDRADAGDDFNAQTITLYNPKHYNLFYIFFVQHSTSHEADCYIYNDGIAQGGLTWAWASSGVGVRARTRWFGVTKSGDYISFTFEDALDTPNATTSPTTNNDAAKPWFIYGAYRESSNDL